MFPSLFRHPTLIGTILGATYGLVVRFVFGGADAIDSVTFIFVVPLVLGVLPILLASEQYLVGTGTTWVAPCATITACFITMLITELEVLICLLLFAIPYFFVALAGAFMVRAIRLSLIAKNRARDNNNTLLSVSFLLLPFLLCPLEKQLAKPTVSQTVANEIVIDATPRQVWQNIVAVPDIRPEEYTPGFFHALGIPRPLRATVTAWALNGQRTGYFEGGLQFREHIKAYVLHEAISFDISVVPETIPDEIFQQHILAGQSFAFTDAAYTLKPAAGGRTRLTLTSRYRITSNINAYAAWWGDMIVQDFQSRLLDVLKHRCESAK
jgi:hypothetical protein